MGLRINASTGAIGADTQVALTAEDFSRAINRLLGGLQHQDTPAARDITPAQQLQQAISHLPSAPAHR